MVEEQVRTEHYQTIGTVSFVRKPSVRSLRITVRSTDNVRVTCPGHMSFQAARQFVEEKSGWIRRQQERMVRTGKRIMRYDEGTMFRTRDHVLSIGTHDKSTIQAIVKNGIIRVCYPDFADVGDVRIQAAVRRAIHAVLKMEAVKYLPGLTARLARENGFSYDRVTVRNNKTRWGSCSARNRISLNIHLVRLPERLLEYVILHELCHTVHRHHQKSFWQLLDRITGGMARKLDRELNGYDPAV